MWNVEAARAQSRRFNTPDVCRSGNARQQNKTEQEQQCGIMGVVVLIL